MPLKWPLHGKCRGFINGKNKREAPTRRHHWPRLETARSHFRTAGLLTRKPSVRATRTHVAPEASREKVASAKGLRGFSPTKPQTERTKRISVAVHIPSEMYELFGFSGPPTPPHPGAVLFRVFLFFLPWLGTILLCVRGELKKKKRTNPTIKTP